MKRVRTAIRAVAGILLGGYLLLLLFVNFGPLQDWITHLVEQALCEKLHTELCIGRVEIGLFNQVSLHDVQLKDQQGSTLLSAGTITVKVELRPLLSGRVNLRTAALLDAGVYLRRRADNEPLNAQFVLDAFKKTDDGKPSSLNLSIGSLIIRRASLTYDNLSRPCKRTLDSDHLALYDIDANLSLTRLTPGELEGRVRSLTFKEKSGLYLQALTLRLHSDAEGVTLRNLLLRMPHSVVEQRSFALLFNRKHANAPLLTRIQIPNQRLDKIELSSSDFAFLAPWADSLRLSLRADHAHVALHDGTLTAGLALTERRAQTQLRVPRLTLRLHPETAAMTRSSIEIDRFTVKRELLSRLFQTFAHNPLPGPLSSLGEVTWQGKASLSQPAGAQERKLVLLGALITQAGRVNLEARLLDSENKQTINTKLRTHDLQPEKILPKRGLPKLVDMELEATARLQQDAVPQARATLHINKLEMPDLRQLQDLTLSGELAPGQLQVTASSNDPNAQLSASASAKFAKLDQLKKISDVSLQADVRHLQPSKLGLLRTWGEKAVRLKLAAKSSSMDLAKACSEVSVQDLQLTGVPDQDAKCDYFHLTTTPNHLTIDADFMQADVAGPLSLRALSHAWQALRSEVMNDGGHAATPKSNDEWRLRLQLRDARLPAILLGIPLRLGEPVKVAGNFTAAPRRMSLTLSAPGITYAGEEISGLSLHLSGNGVGEYNALLQGTTPLFGTNVQTAVQLQAAGGRIWTDVNWEDALQERFRGAVSTVSCAKSGIDGQRLVHTEFKQTQVEVGDTLWQIAPSSVDWNGHRLYINDFAVSHADQSLHVSGALTPDRGKGLLLRLHRFDIAYALSPLHLKPVAFSGLADGEADVSLGSAGSGTQIDARLLIPEFRFNDALLGNSDIRLKYNTAEGSIHFNAAMRESGVGYTKVQGFVSPKAKGLDLNVESQNTSLRFLRRYISDLFGDIDGRMTGNVRIYGPFKGLDFEGRERVDVSAKILSTGVRYAVQGVARLEPGRFLFDDFTVHDPVGGNASLQGGLYHQHLGNMTYDFSLASPTHIQLYNLPRSPEMPFAADVRGSGNVRLQGHPGSFYADIHLSPTQGTRFDYSVYSPTAADENLLLRKVSGEEKNGATMNDREPAAIPPQTRGNESYIYPAGILPSGPSPSLVMEAPRMQESAAHEDEQDDGPTTDIRLDFDIDMNPAATLHLIMDERSGDDIVLRGNGKIGASFYNKRSLQMYGLYRVSGGQYRMSVQDLIRKTFDFQPGGTITFSGDPYKADLNLQAVYTVPSASLADLGIGNLKDASVRVGCLLNIGGRPEQPSVTFDLQLPQASPEVQQMVRQLISTEEDMNMQIVYLLGVGRFYSYNYTAQATAGTSQSATAVNSFLSSTLSSQLNSIIENAMGGKHNWKVGTNLATGTNGWNDIEVEGILQGSMLNNRLLFNGNFGYRDRPTSTTNFVGDFDLKYLLTPSGSVALKAYSQTSDRYFSKSSLTTQGIGLQLSRQFTNLRDLFSSKRRKAKHKKTDKSR